MHQQIQPAPSCSHVSLAPSNTIPLPRSHICRTPSEIQLADEICRAEHDDVRMYARLVVGMQTQIQRDYFANGGIIHPLSKKSLQGIVKTKQANDEDLEKLDCESDDDWEMSYIEERDEYDSFASQWSTPTYRPPSKSNSDDSLSTFGSMNNEEEEEDDFMFSLEL